MIKQFKKLNLGTKRLIVLSSILLPIPFASNFSYTNEKINCYVGVLATIWLIIFVVLWIRDGYTQSKNNKTE